MCTGDTSPNGNAIEPDEKIDQHVATFKALPPFQHRTLMDAFDKVKGVIRLAEPGEIAVVVGPAGVGKRALTGMLQQWITERYLLGPGELSSLSIEIPAPDGGKYNWKDTWVRSLEVAREPLADAKVDVVARVARGALRVEMGAQAAATIRGGSQDIRRAYEHVLKNRRPRAVFLDEAHHLRIIPFGTDLADQLDVFKSIANITGVPHVLLGTYELLDFWGLNSGTPRRFRWTHFPRYRPEESDVLEYGRALEYFQERLPAPLRRTRLTQRETARMLFEVSVGCVGTTKHWLNRAAQLALDRGLNSITQEVLEEKIVEDSSTLREKVLEGEADWYRRQPRRQGPTIATEPRSESSRRRTPQIGRRVGRPAARRRLDPP